jgi:S1-C subfamily serine protease
MELKRHHKIILGGAGSFVIIAVIILGVFMYLLFLRQNTYYTLLSQKIDNLKTDTQAKFNEFSDNLLSTKNDLKSLGLQVGSIDSQIAKLKASATSDFSGIIETDIKSVVIVKTDISQGSGFIITSDGYLVTNAHVMEGATSAGVVTYDGNLHQVKLIGKDTNMDIALLKIDGTYSPLNLANSNDVQVGEKVIAIGSPYGLQFSVTEGIVSNVHQLGENGIKAYIQTDAPLNPGNSGGPLIDTSGKVVGINNFKIGGGESLGFALEANYVKESVNAIYGSNLI